jgi:mRNA interferase MazF
MVIRRGELWWANLPTPQGSEPGYRRPVLIIQSDEFNRSGIQTVIVVVLTSNTKLARAPGNVLLTSKETGLPKDSVANISQVATIDKSILAKRIGLLTARSIQRVEDGLRLSMKL